jgi:N-acetylneuraminate synthase/N,N'-diacetyllegionaminate synthase
MKKFFNHPNKTFVIAEIGVNHNNNISLAKKLIKNAKIAGADAVKFQTFKAKDLVIPGNRKVKYQLNSSKDNEDHYQMIKKLELSYRDHKTLFNYCKKMKIIFLSTPYDVKSAKFLQKLGVKMFKTASADLIDYNLHNYLAKLKKPVIISTGMSSKNEIKKTVQIYRKNKNLNIALLHCVSNYPCSIKSINLNVLNTLKKFGFIVGYSDHSDDILIPCLAVSAGSRIIEKHFTLNRNLKGPDHKASFNSYELKKMIAQIRKTELAMGNKTKKIQLEELEMSKISKKSLYFNKNLKQGSKIKNTDLISLRPGLGINPFSINKIIGKRLKTNIKKNQIVKFNLLF